MCLKNRLTILVVFIFHAVCYCQATLSFSLIESDLQKKEFTNSQKWYVSSDQKKVKNVSIIKPDRIEISIATPFGPSINLKLTKVNILDDNFNLISAKSGLVNYEAGVFYQAKLENGFASFAIQNESLNGVISFKNKKNLVITKDKTSELYQLFYEDKIEENPDFICHTKETELEIDWSKISGLKRRTEKCVSVYLEADYDLFLSKGSISNVADFLMQVWIQVNIIFENEGIQVVISEIKVWDIDDPYSDNNAENALDDFMNSVPNFNGDIAHLISGGTNNLGGIAYIDVLCTDFNYGYSNITNNFNSFPQYSWTVGVLVHEIGHNLGSPHTHACAWPFGAIDNCASPEGTCNSGPAPDNGGTIMSYCNTTSSGINFENGFGFFPGNLIREKVDDAFCLSNCESEPEVILPIANFTSDLQEGCAGIQVSYSNASMNNPVNYLWSFPGGIPESSTEENPTILYNTVGVYAVTLEVSNEAGSHMETKQDYITISDMPSVDFSVNVDQGTVEFSSIIADGIIDVWDFGDGNFSNEENPIHTYASNGEYKVELSASNECGTNYFNDQIEISFPPNVDFSYEVIDNCGTSTVRFESLSSNYTDLIWNFPNGTPENSISENPLIVFSNAENINVQLIATNNNYSESTEKQVGINIISEVKSSFTYERNGLTIQLNSDENNAESYLWDFGDGNVSNEQNPQHIYQSPGEYTISLYVENECYSAEEFKQLIVFDELMANVIPYTDAVCLLDTIQLQSSTSDSPIEYYWELLGPEILTSSMENPRFVFHQSGNYDLYFYVASPFDEDEVFIENFLSVKEYGALDFEFIINDLNVELLNYSQAFDEYEWHFGDGNVIVGNSVSHTYDSEGIYEIKLVGKNDCQTDTLVRYMDLYTRPIAFFQTEKLVYCKDDVIEFKNLSSSNNLDFNWFFEGADIETSQEINPIVTYPQVGSYNVELIVSNPSFSDTLWIENYIEIIEKPSTEFDYTLLENQIHLSLVNSDADSLAWFVNDELTLIGIDSLTYTFDSFGIFDVKLIAINDCGIHEYVDKIEVGVIPDASFSINSSDICKGDTIFFKAAINDTIDYYEWRFDGGIPEVSFEANPNVSYMHTGEFNVTLIVGNALGADTLLAENKINVKDAPFANYNFESLGPNIQFQNLSTNYDSVSWISDMHYSIEESPNFEYAENGQYPIQLTVINACGVDSISGTININAYPFASIAFDTLVCQGDTVAFTSFSQNASEVLWELGILEEEIRSENFNFVFDDFGEYDVLFIAKNYWGSDSIFIKDAISIKPKPISDFDIDYEDDTATFIDLSEHAESYFWDFGNGAFSEEQGDHIKTYEKNTLYEVSLLTTNECGQDLKMDSIYLQEDISTSINEKNANDIEIIPNPSNGLFNIHTNNKVISIKTISVYNFLGEKLKEIEGGQINTYVNRIPLNLSDLTQGSYLLELKSEDVNIVKKILVYK